MTDENSGSSEHSDSSAVTQNASPSQNPGSGPTPDGVGAAAPEGSRANEGPPRSRTRWVVAAMAALAVALFTVPLLRGPSGSPTPTASTASGGAEPASGGTCPESEGAANFNFTLKDMNGTNVRLTNYRGKVILLNFWATWCGPCKAEIPELVEVYSEYRGRGFEILGVLSEDEPSSDDLHKFTSAFKMNYPIFRAHEDFENVHGPIWALPTTYVIDRKGSICSKHMGPVSRQMVEREIKGLL